MKTQEVLDGMVRKEVAESWRRSFDRGLDPHSLDTPTISSEELARRKISSKNLLEIARPYMHNLYSFFKGSGFAVILADKDGYLLETLSDEIYGAKTKDSKCVEGVDRSEKSAGTNAVGTCLELNIPLQIWAGEHYCRIRHEWTCSAAPIHDINGEILGCYCISGPWHLVHPHTLGMAVAAADAIEKQLYLENANTNISLINSQLEGTLNSISDGVIVINKDRRILQINGPAEKLIQVPRNFAIGADIDELLQSDGLFSNLLKSNLNIEEEEQNFNTKNGLLNLYLSTKFVSDKNNPEGLVITLKEMKSVRKMINKMTRSQAFFHFDNIIGKSELITDAIKIAKIAANSTSNLLLSGESGTGKEMFAQAVHNHSMRKNGPFIAVNCASLPRGLVESELFGYEGGSFTGSKKEGHPGKFELAHGGTIFLDEIGDMPLEIQVNLLRVIQNREIVRVGGTTPKFVDVRIIAATNKDLAKEVEASNFRHDLYYRLNVLFIAIPSLRERKDDIPMLADAFMQKYNHYLNRGISSLDPEVYTALIHYDWPGNIRELENVVERAVNITQNDHVTLKDLPLHFQQVSSLPDTKPIQTPTMTTSDSMDAILPVKTLEINAIVEALKICNGNIKKAAEMLGIGRRTLYNKLSENNIPYGQYR